MRLGQKPVLPPPEKPLEWSPDSPLPAVDEPKSESAVEQKVAASAPVAANLSVGRQAAPPATSASRVEVVVAEASLEQAKNLPKKSKKARQLAAFDDDEGAVVAVDPRRGLPR